MSHNSIVPSGVQDEPSEVAPEWPQRFYQRVSEAYSRSEQLTGRQEYYLRIAGSVVRILFSGEALIETVMPPLAHFLIEASAKPDFTISLWDAARGVPLPQRPEEINLIGDMGELTDFAGSDILAIFRRDIGSLTIMSMQQRTAFVGMKNGSEVPLYERAAPLRDVMHHWQAAQGRQLVHGAAVGTPEGGVLLVGKGGSGKSTTALACVQAGLLYAGDDYVLLEANPKPFVYGIYNSAKLNQQSLNLLRRSPSPSSYLIDDQRAKTVLSLAEDSPDRLSAGFPLLAVLAPRVTGLPTSSLQPTSMVATLAALVPNTIAQLPLSGQDTLRRVASVISQVPSYTLLAGTAIVEIPDLIKALLKERG